MRLNKFLAGALGLSRREADELISGGRIKVNEQTAILGQPVDERDTVALDGRKLQLEPKTYLALNKPAGFVSSRRGQGTPSVYALLPERYRSLKSVGRLDKDSSGLLLLTNDGDYAHQLTHPRFAKTKVYEVEVGGRLSQADWASLDGGINLTDGPSRLRVEEHGGGKRYLVTMREGRNRQIRRTFAALGHEVKKLHRVRFGPYSLDGLKSGQYEEVPKL